MRRVSPCMRRTLVLAAVAGLALSSVPATAGTAKEVRTEAFRLLNEGVAAYRRGDTALAVDALSRSSSMALNNFRAHYFYGKALIQDRRYREAIVPLEVALDLDPSHLLAHVALGDAHLKLGDVDEAHAEYFRALRLKPEFPPALDGIARTHEARGDVEKAVAGYRKTIEADRGYAPAYTHLGDLHLARGEFDLAIRALRDAVGIRPDYAPGLNRLALAYGRLGRFNEAVATVGRAIELEPGSPDHLSALGALHLQLGNLATAEEAFLEALTLDPAWPDARSGMAESARRRGEYETALEELGLALADDRLDGRTERRLEEQRDAVARERELWLELERRDADGTASDADLRAIASVLAGRGDFDGAFDRIRRTGPGTRDDREFEAWLAFQVGRYRLAHERYAALAEETGASTAWLDAGAALARLGRDEDAADAFRRALEIDPALRRARLFLGSALLRSGRDTEALETWRPLAASEVVDETAERARRLIESLEPAVPGEAP